MYMYIEDQISRRKVIAMYCIDVCTIHVWLKYGINVVYNVCPKIRVAVYPSSLFALCAGPQRDTAVGGGVSHVTVIGDVVVETAGVVALETREVVPKIVGGAKGERNSLPKGIT